MRRFCHAAVTLIARLSPIKSFNKATKQLLHHQPAISDISYHVSTISARLTSAAPVAEGRDEIDEHAKQFRAAITKRDIIMDSKVAGGNRLKYIRAV